MPLSPELKRSILQNPFQWRLRIDVTVDREAYQRLRDDVRRLAGETRDDRQIDKEVLQAIWGDIRVAEGTAALLRRRGRPEDEVFEVENMAIELDGILTDCLSVSPPSKDWGWWLDTSASPQGPPSNWPQPDPTSDPPPVA